jgi:hypothetical protein
MGIHRFESYFCAGYEAIFPDPMGIGRAFQASLL